MLNEFKKFILRGNVVDLAVGIVIGAAFTGVVNSFVRDIINPIVETFYHGDKFSQLHWGKFLYGDLLNNLLSFLIVACVVFFFVVQPINHLTERFIRSKDTEEETTRKCPECLSVIPKEAKRCKFCTASVRPKS